MGLRIEHPRELIDRGIYGGHRRPSAPRRGGLRPGGPNPSRRSASVPAACWSRPVPEWGGVCTNGISAQARDGEFTNAALVATVQPKEFGAGPLSGLEYQRSWEREAFQAGGGDYSAPAQGAEDFLAGRVRHLARSTTYPFGVRPAGLDRVLPARRPLGNCRRPA